MHNLFNVKLPLSAQAANASENFYRFAAASDKIVQALLEGTYAAIVKPRNWRQPDVIPYMSDMDALRNDLLKWLAKHGIDSQVFPLTKGFLHIRF